MWFKKKIHQPQPQGLKIRNYSFATIASGNGWIIEWIRPLAIYGIYNHLLTCDISFPDVQETMQTTLATVSGPANNQSIEYQFEQIGTAGVLIAENQSNIRIGAAQLLTFNPIPIISRSMRIQMSAGNGTISIGIYYLIH